MEWNERYSVGIERSDHQHQYFLEMINWLDWKLRVQDLAVLRQRYLEELIRYAAFHFFSEENQMLEMGYPQWEQHRVLHQTVLNNLSQVVSRLEMGEIDAGELIDFLEKWFVEHTSTEDVRIAQFLAKRSEAGNES